MTTPYDFSATAIDGAERQLADYKGKVLLVVDTATANAALLLSTRGSRRFISSTRTVAWRCWDFRAINSAPRSRARRMRLAAFCKRTMA